MEDCYKDNRKSGSVINTCTADGTLRKGCDLERQVAIDNGALRFRPLMKPGWGRQGIIYGPYQRANGLAFASLLCNGHNTSQSERIESLKMRLHRWWLGSETEPPFERFKKWLKAPQKRGSLRRLLWWIKTAPEFAKYFSVPRLDENLAVGWFSSAAALDPTAEEDSLGNGFVVRATGFNNGELLARTGKHLMSAFQGLQNLQTYYVVVLRQQGAAYYVASVPRANGFSDYPNMRPVGIDPFDREESLYAGVYQSVLGQIGFRVDTRVYGSKVAQVPAWSAWYGSAHVADALVGDGLFRQRHAETGGTWTLQSGEFELTEQGMRAKAGNSEIALTAPSPSGLIHVVIRTSKDVTRMGIRWRMLDASHYWEFTADSRACRLYLHQEGLHQEDLYQESLHQEAIAISELWHLEANKIHSLQIVDNAQTFRLYLDGELVFNKAFNETRLQEATGIGLVAAAANHQQFFSAFEAHPRALPIPSVLDVGSPWQAAGDRLIAADDFTGKSQLLEERKTSVGSFAWQKTLGQGVVITAEDIAAAEVKASIQCPNPGRTAFTIPWKSDRLADLQVDIVPPGQQRYQGEKGRGGLIFWQDEANYITISNWLDDDYDGASISSFFYLNGYEELYDAVWTNVADRVSWGKAHCLRIVFDGMRYMAFINDEPVLYRALSDVYPKAKRLSINRVGIVANWEWGNDTGSLFKNFMAKGM